MIQQWITTIAKKEPAGFLYLHTKLWSLLVSWPVHTQGGRWSCCTMHKRVYSLGYPSSSRTSLVMLLSYLWNWILLNCGWQLLKRNSFDAGSWEMFSWGGITQCLIMATCRSDSLKLPNCPYHLSISVSKYDFVQVDHPCKPLTLNHHCENVSFNGVTITEYLEL